MVEIRRQRRHISSTFRWDLIVKGSLEAYYRREAWEEAGIQQKDKCTHKHASNRERREGKGEMGDVEIGREGSEEGKGRRTGKF